MESEMHISQTTYNALNRPLEVIMPDNSAISHHYNRGGLPKRVTARIHGADVPTVFVKSIDYDAKGQRTEIYCGNGVGTSYDPLTFRLIHMKTCRDPGIFPDDGAQNRSTGWPGSQIENLQYTYDATGNITHIHNNAQQTSSTGTNVLTPTTTTPTMPSTA
jgi:hypothetical protein